MFRYKCTFVFTAMLASAIVIAMIARNQRWTASEPRPAAAWSAALSSEHEELRKVGESLIKPYQFPVALSPNGKLLLVKEKTPNAFALRVYKGANMLAKLDLVASPWELAWSPSGATISFLAESEHPGEYDLYVWCLASNQLTVLSDRKTNSAAFGFKWSPDNQHVAYIAYGRGESRLVLITAEGRRFRMDKIIENINPESGLAWSANSEHLVFARVDLDGSSIRIYSLKSHETRELTPSVRGNVRDLSWAPSPSSIAFAFRGDKDKYFRLAQLPSNGRIQYCTPQNGDVESPTWIDRSGKIEYLLETDSDQSLYVEKGCDQPSRLFHPRSGSGRVQTDGYDHIAVPFIEAEVDGPPRLLLPQRSDSSHLNDSGEPPSSEPAQQLWLSGSSHPVPAWLWSARTTQSPGRGLVIVHGGPHLHESGGWEPLRDAFRRSGYSVLAPNYGGSSGYGREHESILSLDVQASDVLAAIRYLSTSQGISSENTVVVASSYGSRVVLRALEVDPHMCGIVIFAPFLVAPTDIDSDNPLPFDGVVLAFHGQDDTISDPQSALVSLRKIFKIAVSRDRFYWRQFDNEGHGFGRISSLQEEYGTISCIAELASCANRDHMRRNRSGR
jgi:dienelactone hydrolase